LMGYLRERGSMLRDRMRFVRHPTDEPLASIDD
jgi:hypothetical protein